MFSHTALVAFVVSAIAVSAQTTQPVCSRLYTVQSGDQCETISAAQHVSTYQLATINSGTINANCSNLFVGQVLCLGIVGQDCSTVHVVTSGETCPVIASNAGISVGTLLANNPNVNAACTNIHVGEVLCTDSHIFV